MTHFLIALAIALIAAAPLAYPGPLQTHAGATYLFPSFGSQTISLAVSAARWLQAVGLPTLDAYKAVDAFAIVIGTVGMFALVRPRQGSAAALVASGLYTLLPYRLMLLYVQGARGESLFWSIIPWLCVAGLMVAAWLGRTGIQRKVALTLALIAGGGLALVVWQLCVPYRPQYSPAYLFQLFSARWGDGTRGDWLDAVPIQLGLAPLGLTVAAMVVRRTRATIVLTAIAALCALLSVEPVASRWAWYGFLNVPWQLVGVAGLCLSLAGGSLFTESDAREQQIPLLAAALTITVLASYPYLQTKGIDFTPAHPAIADFENGVMLLDAGLSAPLQPGTTMTVTLIWQNVLPPDADYHVFVHVLDASDRLVTQRDRPPLDGARPTTTWRRGEVLRDSYALTIPPSAPRDLRVAVGMYRYPSGERVRWRLHRLPDVWDEGDMVFVAGVR